MAKVILILPPFGDMADNFFKKIKIFFSFDDEKDIIKRRKQQAIRILVFLSIATTLAWLSPSNFFFIALTLLTVTMAMYWAQFFNFVNEVGADPLILIWFIYTGLITFFLLMIHFTDSESVYTLVKLFSNGCIWFICAIFAYQALRLICYIWNK